MASFLSKVSMLTTRLEELKKPIDEAMVITKILASLPESYEMFRVSWSSSSASDKTMANLTCRLLQEEARQQEKNPRSGSSDAFFVKNSSGKSFSGTCFNCGKRGHRAASVEWWMTVTSQTLAMDRNNVQVVHLLSLESKQMLALARTTTIGWRIQEPLATCVQGRTGSSI